MRLLARLLKVEPLLGASGDARAVVVEEVLKSLGLWRPRVPRRAVRAGRALDPSAPGAVCHTASPMHELSLAQGIIDIVEAQASRERFTRVRRIRLLVGALAHVEPDALSFGFESVARGTVAEGAVLEIERPPGEGECASCGAAVAMAQRGEACLRCGSYQVLVTRGEELRVLDLEVE